MATPLIVHVIHRLGVGGLENGLVNLVDRLHDYRHAIVCLTEATDFRRRIRRGDVAIHELHKREGQDLALYHRLYRLLRRLRPAVVHTRNLAALECQLPAWLAGVPVRIHGEHGWDVFDPEGGNRKYQWLRRAFRPLIHHYVPLSRQLEAYLTERIGVPAAKITRICNGVNTERFRPPEGGREPIPGCPFTDPDLVLVGTVGRMHGVKDQVTLARAFAALLRAEPRLRRTVRLVMVGDGPLRRECGTVLAEAGLGDLAWLPGARDDVPRVLRGLDLFVLPSRAEGISNTILEAMATGLPVVATHVGGNGELVRDGVSGYLVPPADPARLAEAMAAYLKDPALRHAHGREGRRLAVAEYTLAGMCDAYGRLYARQLAERHVKMD